MRIPSSVLAFVAVLGLTAAAVAEVPTLLPSQARLSQILAGDSELAAEVTAIAAGWTYRHVLAAYAHVQAVHHLTSGHLIDAARWKRIAGKVLRGEPVPVEYPVGVAFPVGETVTFDLVTAVPIVGQTRVGRAVTKVLPALLTDGKVLTHITAEVVVEKFQPGSTRQEIYADAESFLLQRSEVTEMDGSGSVKDRWVDVFDHPAHRVVRQRPGQAAQVFNHPATHTMSAHAWVPYAMRASGFDVGTTVNLSLVSDDVPFVFKIGRKTNLGSDRVFEGMSTPDRIKAWFFDDGRRLPRRVVMQINLAISGSDQPRSRQVTLEFKSVQG